jgi:hypothetical protein
MLIALKPDEAMALKVVKVLSLLCAIPYRLEQLSFVNFQTTLHVYFFYVLIEQRNINCCTSVMF